MLPPKEVHKIMLSTWYSLRCVTSAAKTLYYSFHCQRHRRIVQHTHLAEHRRVNKSLNDFTKHRTAATTYNSQVTVRNALLWGKFTQVWPFWRLPGPKYFLFGLHSHLLPRVKIIIWPSALHLGFLILIWLWHLLNATSSMHDCHLQCISGCF